MLYELTIYTAGTRFYALKVAHAICRSMVGAEDVDGFDPAVAKGKEKEAVELRRVLFGARIVSRTDTGDVGFNVKSLARVFPDGGELSVILDDREDVWAAATNNSERFTLRRGEPPLNCLVVRPYKFEGFGKFEDVNNGCGEGTR